MPAGARDEPSLDPTIDSFLREAAQTSLVSQPGQFTGTERYELTRIIGEGRFGVVFEAIDHVQGGRVALKLLRHRRLADQERLERELRALRALRQRNLVRSYELTACGHELFVTMERVDGLPWLEHARQSPERMRATLTQLAAALQALHDGGWVHGDVKPANVRVEATGRVVLLDCGLALEPEDRPSPALAGTPLYVSPEQCAGQPPGPPSDCYAVGVMLYQALTGRAPFAGSVHDVLAAKRAGVVVAPSAVATVPPDLDALCVELLAHEPARRPTAGELGRRLGAAPTPSMSTSAPFVGRAVELAELGALVDDAARGRRGLAWLAGAPALGKSALVNRFAADVTGRGATLLRGRCASPEARALGGLDEVIDALASQLRRHDAPRVDLAPADALALVALFPALAAVLPDARATGLSATGDAPAPRTRALTALRTLLAQLASQRPLVICLDDVHLADADSADVLAELVRAPNPPPVAWLLAVDDTAPSALVTRWRQLRATVLRELPVCELHLPPLGDDEARRLAAQLLGGDDERAATIVGEAAGSPQLVVALAALDGAGRTVRALATAQLSALDGPTRRLADVAAVAGDPIAVTVAAAVAGIAGDAGAAVSALAATQLFRTRDRLLVAAHPRVAAAIADALPADERRRLLRALVTALAGAAAAAATARDFAAAARDYALAIALRAASADDRDGALELAWADALAATGAARAAAAAYQRAAPLFAGDRRAVPLARAAVALMHAADVDAGVAALAGARVVLGLPRDRRATPLAALAQRALGRRHGAGPSEPADAAAELGIALWRVDPRQSAELAPVHERLARASREPARLATARALAAVTSALDGSPAATRTGRALAEAGDIGRAAVADTVALLEGRWAEVSAPVDDSGDGPWRRQLHAHGDCVRRLGLACAGRAPEAARALAPSDALEAAWAAIFSAWAAVERGPSDDARAATTRARLALPERGWPFPAWWQAFVAARLDLIERDGAATLDATLPDGLLRRTAVSHLQRTLADSVRASAAIARAVTASPSLRASLVREASRLRRRLDDAGAPWSPAAARALGAGIASAAHDHDRALQLLAEAETLADAARLDALAAATRLARGRLIAGTTGHLLVERATAWTRAAEVAPAALWSLVPGRWPR